MFSLNSEGSSYYRTYRIKLHLNILIPMYKLMYIGIKILNNLCTNLCCTTTKKQNTQSLFDGFWYSLDINAMSVNGEIHNACNKYNITNIVTVRVPWENFTKKTILNL